LCSNPLVDKSTQYELHPPNKNKVDLNYLGSASLKLIKDYFECTLKIFQSDFPRSQIRWFSKN